MGDTGHRVGAAVADIGGGAGDGAGGGKTAKQGRDDVGDALADQLLIGVVREPGHAIGDDCRQQRFNRPQHGNRKRRAQQGQHAGQRDSRPLQRG